MWRVCELPEAGALTGAGHRCALGTAQTGGDSLEDRPPWQPSCSGPRESIPATWARVCVREADRQQPLPQPPRLGGGPAEQRPEPRQGSRAELAGAGHLPTCSGDPAPCLPPLGIFPVDLTRLPCSTHLSQLPTCHSTSAGWQPQGQSAPGGSPARGHARQVLAGDAKGPTATSSCLCSTGGGLTSRSLGFPASAAGTILVPGGWTTGTAGGVAPTTSAVNSPSGLSGWPPGERAAPVRPGRSRPWGSAQRQQAPCAWPSTTRAPLASRPLLR